MTSPSIQYSKNILVMHIPHAVYPVVWRGESATIKQAGFSVVPMEEHFVLRMTTPTETQDIARFLSALDAGNMLADIHTALSGGRAEKPKKESRDPHHMRLAIAVVVLLCLIFTGLTTLVSAPTLPPAPVQEQINQNKPPVAYSVPEPADDVLRGED